MKTIRYCKCSFIIVLLAGITQCLAEQTENEPSLNVIATNAFQILRDVPTLGIERSLPGIEQIVETHRRLAQKDNVSQRHLSLVLADAVAYTIVTEIHRAAVARLGTDPGMTPKSVPFDKNTAIRLWTANVPDFPAAIRQSLRGNGALTDYVSTRSSEEDVLVGDIIDQVPLETIQPRLQELREKALHPAAFGKNPSADEQLFFALAKYQAFRDLDVIIKLYEKRDFPNDSSELRAAIDEVLQQSPPAGKRVDDGMKASAFKVWSTYRRYYPQGTSQDPVGPIEEYYLKQALALAPFIADMSSLPETAQAVLVKMKRPR